MLRIKAFNALRPPAEIVSQVASVPYDVVSRDEAIALAQGNEKSFLHVVRPDIDLPATDKEGIYAKGAENLQTFIDNGWLAREDTPRMYLYQLEMNLLGRTVTQTGLVCCCHCEDYTTGIIKKHEKTRQDKEDERTRMVLELNANAEPVFFLIKDNPKVNDLINRQTDDEFAAEPIYDFTAPDGVRHKLFPVPDPSEYERAFDRINFAYVADGHHRTASAARAGEARAKANPNHTGDEEYNWFLTVLFPASPLPTPPFLRIVTTLNGETPDGFLARLKEIGEVRPTDTAQPDKPGKVGVYLGRSHGWRMLEFPAQSIPKKDPIQSLDYVILTERVLGPVLGIEDVRTDPNIGFVGGIRGTGELEKRVDSGEAAVAFAMCPTTIDQLIGVADAGEIMPPKSTWFEPKLRSGLFVHMLD